MHIIRKGLTYINMYNNVHYTGSIFERKKKMPSLRLSAKIPIYHDVFLGNLSLDLKNSIYKSQNSRLYFMDVPGKASIYSRVSYLL